MSSQLSAQTLGTAQGETPGRQRSAVSRSRSFHQAFLQAKSGAGQQSDDQQRSLGVTFPELYKKALLQAYATRPPNDDDQPNSPSASGAKPRFSGVASRIKMFFKPSASPADANQEQSRGEDGSAGQDDGGESGPAGTDAADEGAAEGDTADAEDLPPPASEPDDPAAAALAEEFQAMDESGGGGSGMMGALKGVFDKGGELDNSQSEKGGGAPSPHGDLIKKLKEKMDGGKDDMTKAMDESFSKFVKKDGKGGDKEEAAVKEDVTTGSTPGSGLFSAIQKAASQKLQQAESAAEGGTPGGQQSQPGKARKPPPIEIKSEPRPKVQGRDPWLPSGLSPRQVELRAQARDLVVRHVLPKAARWDKEKTMPRSFLRAAGRLRMCGMVAPLLAGGRGWSYSDAVAVMEVVGAADLNAAAVLAHQNRMAWMMATHAGILHKLPLTAALSAGLLVGTLVASEPLAQRDKDAAKTLSFGIKYKDMSGDYWILNGYKDFAPLCGQADLYLIGVRTDLSPLGVTLFLLPKFYPGMTFMGQMYDTVGVRSMAHRNMVLSCCIVRDEMRVAPGKAVQCIQAAADCFRLFLASAAVGAATTALALAHDWLLDPAHRHFSHSLIGYQALEHRVVGLLGKVDSARLLVQHAAAAFDAKAKTTPAHAALAKRFAVNTAFEVLESVRTLFGAASVHVSYPLDRVRRNLIAYQLLGGDMEDCVDLAWTGLVSRRKVKGKKGGKGGAKKKKKRIPPGRRGDGEEEEEQDEGEDEDEDDDDEDEDED